MAPTETAYPQVIAVANLKGGVGKTTLCVNLAYGIAYFAKKRVLVIDLDPQANATQYLIPEPKYRKLYLSDPPQKLTVTDVYSEYDTPDRRQKLDSASFEYEKYINRVYSGQAGHLDLVASNLELSVIAAQNSGYKIDQIRWFIGKVGKLYDIVLIDCPPTVSRLLWGAFEAAQYVLVPVKPEFLSTIGLPLLQHIITEDYAKHLARRTEPPITKPLHVLGIVFTMVEPRLSMTAESVAEVQRQAVEYGYAVFASIVSHSTKYSWSSRQTLPIFRSEPNSRYSSEIQILVNEFIERLEEAQRV